jgi:hypothetical protein
MGPRYAGGGGTHIGRQPKLDRRLVEELGNTLRFVEEAAA